MYSESLHARAIIKEKKRIANLKNGVAYVEESRDELLFIIPKYIARDLGNPKYAVEKIPATVYVKRGHGSTDLIDLDVGTLLTLVRRSGILKKRIITKNVNSSHTDEEYIKHLSLPERQSFNEFIGRVTQTNFSLSGRRCDIEIQMVL